MEYQGWFHSPDHAEHVLDFPLVQLWHPVLFRWQDVQKVEQQIIRSQNVSARGMLMPAEVVRNDIGHSVLNGTNVGWTDDPNQLAKPALLKVHDATPDTSMSQPPGLFKKPRKRPDARC